jgi:hypothetical protein
VVVDSKGDVMREMLADIRTKIALGAYRNEEHVRLAIVARILSQLGWNIWDPMEVNCEFNPVPHEDKTRVDIALFSRPRVPDVFIETKPIGRIASVLRETETQVRNYNRDNTALFSIITDGCEWRFYLSRAGGKFSEKCFKIVDLRSDDLDDIQTSFFKFLQKAEIVSGNAEREANGYLRLGEKQRAMEDMLPQAKRAILEPPYPSLPCALQKMLSENGIAVSIDEAEAFIIEMRNRPSCVDEPGDEQVAMGSPEIAGAEHMQQTDLIPYIIAVLKDHGGRARKELVDRQVYAALEVEFRKPWYQETVALGIPRWQHSIAWAKERAKRDDLIKSPKESGRGYWELTESGRRYNASVH